MSKGKGQKLSLGDFNKLHGSASQDEMNLPTAPSGRDEPSLPRGPRGFRGDGERPPRRDDRDDGPARSDESAWRREGPSRGMSSSRSGGFGRDSSSEDAGEWRSSRRPGGFGGSSEPRSGGSPFGSEPRSGGWREREAARGAAGGDRFGDRSERSGGWGDRSERPERSGAWGDRSERPERSGAWSDRSERPERSTGGWGDRSERPSSFGPRGEGAWRPSSERGGDRPSFGGDRPSYGGDRPSYGGDRPSYGGDRPSFGGDRPSFGGDRYGSSRPGFGAAERPAHLRFGASRTEGAFSAPAPRLDSAEAFPELGAAPKKVVRPEPKRAPATTSSGELRVSNNRFDPFGGAVSRNEPDLAPVSIKKAAAPVEEEEEEEEEYVKPKGKKGAKPEAKAAPAAPSVDLSKRGLDESLLSRKLVAQRKSPLEQALEERDVLSVDLLTESLGDLKLSAGNTRAQLVDGAARSLADGSLSLSSWLSVSQEKRGVEEAGELLVDVLQSFKEKKSDRELVELCKPESEQVMTLVKAAAGDKDLDAFLGEKELIVIKPVSDLTEDVRSSFASGKSADDVLAMVTASAGDKLIVSYLAPVVLEEALKGVFEEKKSPKLEVLSTFGPLLKRVLLNDHPAQGAALFQLQGTWFQNGSDKSIILPLFQKMEAIIEPQGYVNWLENVKNKTPGRVPALLKVSSFVKEQQAKLEPEPEEYEGDEGEEYDDE